MKYIISLLKFLGASTLVVIGAYQWFTHEIKQVARAEVDNVKTEIQAVRDRKSTRLNSSHSAKSRMPSSA